MTLRKITIDNSVKDFSILWLVHQVKILIITSQRLFQHLEKKTKTFHKIIKNSCKLFQHQNSEWLNEYWIVTFNSKKYTDTCIQQTETKPQETLDIKVNKQMEYFSFSPPINLVEEGKRLLAVTSFEVTNSVFNITNENNSFSLTIPVQWSSRIGAETIYKLQKFRI